MKHKVLVIQNPEGLRARPAAQFVQLASGFISTMLIEKGNKKVNAKSIMGVLSLGVGEGETIHLFIDGPDEDIAMSAMVELTKKG
ncbi:MAG: HPr family phosphocarrier protein [Clostridiales bacterium]|jgi:phosphocarrier protein|nr:HPr family phosphocarrier protein [Clostridiales bacterium]